MVVVKGGRGGNVLLFGRGSARPSRGEFLTAEWRVEPPLLQVAGTSREAYAQFKESFLAQLKAPPRAGNNATLGGGKSGGSGGRDGDLPLGGFSSDRGPGAAW